MVISWLTSNASANLLSGILCSSNAFRIQNDLQERFDKVNMTRIYHLLRAICILTQGIFVFYSKMKDLLGKMDSIVAFPPCNCNESKEYVVHIRNQRLLMFLMRLNDSNNDNQQ